VLASLNHPNVAHIYSIEESSETRCIVMELVEGETLQARLKHGPLPVDEVLTIARQIADALEAAHEKGVIHRDLKPGNVMEVIAGAKMMASFRFADNTSNEKFELTAELTDFIDCGVGRPKHCHKADTGAHCSQQRRILSGYSVPIGQSAIEYRCDSYSGCPTDCRAQSTISQSLLAFYFHFSDVGLCNSH
jgi:serine/threonine protein kinase